MKKVFIYLLFLFICSPLANAQEVINTSFEEYTLGNINNQDKWSVTKGTAIIINNTDNTHAGDNALSIISTSGSQIDHIAYTKTQEGISEDVYVDFWVKVNSIGTSAFSITGYDLVSSSRSFMIEFTTNGKIKVYNKSSGSTTIQPSYTLEGWNRLSFKINNSSATYQFALNGTPYEDVLEFREIKNNATTFAYHSVRFLQSSGTSDLNLDDIYIGTSPINGVNFVDVGPIEKQYYTLSVSQPQNATISVQPEPTDGKYLEGTKVTANIAISDPCKYKFSKWVGDASGTTSPITFTVSKDMSISAELAEIPETGTIRSVKNYNELKSALESMNPGDIIELEDGNYSGNALTVTQGGCSERPIIIRAKNIGQAKLTGKLYFTLRNVSYLTFEGLNFDLDPVSSIFKMEGCSYVHITKNEFRMKKETEGQTSKWILVGDEWNKEVCTSHHNRIDYNLFDGKYDGGAWVVIDGAHGTSPGDISKYDVIAYNHFRNNTPRADNEKETIRIGVSDLTPCSAYCTVEYNLFENCDGDPEVVSVKSCDNLIKGNTFRGCLGTVCLRQGFRNVVDGNYFFGDNKTVDGNGCGGVRVYGKDHLVINNYFEGLTGQMWDAACTITNGDAANTSSSWSAHFIPENVVFAFNTYVNNKSDIEIGFTNNDKYGRTPVNCLITNNIYIQNENPIIKYYSDKAKSGVTFANNIMHATNTGSIGASIDATQALQIDPMLVLSDCRTDENDCNNRLPYPIYKLSKNSPAIDKAIINSNYAKYDFEGQIRTGNKDIGADEYNNEAISYGVLGAEHVGPYAIAFELDFSNSINPSYKNDYISITQSTDKSINIKLSADLTGETTVKIYNMNGVQIFTQTASSELNIPMQANPNGAYLVNVTNKGYNTTYKIILK